MRRLRHFKQEEFHAPMAEINTTPLVDVMLVLLVIFLVAAPLLTHTVKLELPNETASVAADENPVQISVDASGQYFWNSAPISQVMLDEKLKALAHKNPHQPIHLYADRQSTYDKVSHILAVAQSHGLSQIGFITRPE